MRYLKNPFLDEERKSAISIQVKSRIEKVIERQAILNRINERSNKKEIRER